MPAGFVEVATTGFVESPSPNFGVAAAWVEDLLFDWGEVRTAGENVGVTTDVGVGVEKLSVFLDAVSIAWPHKGVTHIKNESTAAVNNGCRDIFLYKCS